MRTGAKVCKGLLVCPTCGHILHCALNNTLNPKSGVEKAGAKNGFHRSHVSSGLELHHTGLLRCQQNEYIFHFLDIVIIYSTERVHFFGGLLNSATKATMAAGKKFKRPSNGCRGKAGTGNRSLKNYQIHRP